MELFTGFYRSHGDLDVLKRIMETAAADPFQPQLEQMRDLLEAPSSRIPREDLWGKIVSGALR